MHDDELGAHVSTAGGVQNAPGRAVSVESRNLQLFTKQPNRWAEPVTSDEVAAAFRDARRADGIRVAGAHDSYLINLASPDSALWNRSYRSFVAELQRGRALGLDFLVTHPGNATDGDRAGGLARNAEAVDRALEEVAESPRVLLEITAGAGHALGCSFRELGAIISGIGEERSGRVGVCFDTCHAYSAGYDLVNDYDGVWTRFEDELGLDRLGLFHLNDSKNPFDSRRDRHEAIGKGSLGEGPFRELMLDDRFMGITKLLETPKREDPVAMDLENLNLLRSFRSG